MTLDLYDAHTLEDLVRQCDDRTTHALARLMLRTFATLGAAPKWNRLPELAEELAIHAARFGLGISDQSPTTLARWQEIIDSPAAPPSSTPDLTAAADLFATRFGSPMTAHDLGPRLTCGELEALADLLTATGAATAARHWRTAHAAEDEEGDAHYTPTG